MNKSRHDTTIPRETVIFGFGAQGRAQALNLRDSDVPLSVWLRKESVRADEVRREGIRLELDPAKAAARAEEAVLLIPDSQQPAFYNEYLREHLPEGAALVFAHGFCVHYGSITPRKDLDVLLAAPLAHGEALRRDFLEQGRVPCALAVYQDATGHARKRLLRFAEAMAGRGPFIWTTFREEVEIDLFAEQAVLCGGIPELIKASFETLREQGYNADISSISCLREIRAIVDLMLVHSIHGMRERISETAQYGSVTRGPRIIGPQVRAELKRILGEIRSGAFAQELLEEQKLGFPRLAEAMREEATHELEQAHRNFTAFTGAEDPEEKD